MKDSRTIAAVATVVLALLLALLLVVAHLSVDAGNWPPPKKTVELAEIEEEFVDFLDPAPVHANPAPSYSPVRQKHESEAAPAGGTDLEDAGEAAPAPTVVTTERESPKKEPKKEAPKKTGPTRKELAQEEQRRKARRGVSDAFKAAEKAQDNTTDHGRDKGDSGNPDGEASSLNGSGSGTVGGGWLMPRYAKVDSRQTGSIILQAVIDKSGKVISVEQIGGKAPASANPSLVARCKAEVRAHIFTRHDDNAPDRATARITYTFR